jgi:type II secretory pathway component PulF
MKLIYIAFDKTGRQCTNVIEAADATAAGETLRRQGLYVTKLTMRGAPVAARSRWSSKSKRLKSVAMLTRQLHSLVSCGTPLVEAMAAFERQARAGLWQDTMKDLRIRVEQGSPLSVAMESHPDFFDPVCRSLIGAGESSGTLTVMLDRVAQITRKQLAIRNAVVGAMVYPSMLAVVAVSVLVLMLLFVIPRFGELFESLGVTLPPTTQALLTLSEYLRSYWWAAIIGIAGPIIGLKAWLGGENGRRAVQTAILHLPQVGRIARNFATARLTRVLGMLLDSHVSVLDALSLTRESIGNHHYADLISKAEEAVTQGKNIHVAFANTDLISPGVCEAIRSGEQSGQVGQLLVHIADFLDEDNEVIVKSLTSIIEPVILVLMGLLVGTIAVSMFLPLFDLTAMTKGN